MLRISFILSLVSIVAFGTIYGQTTDGKSSDALNAIRTSVPFLTIAPDSRAGAMGDAGVATTPDINSQYWNAAKYPFIKEQAGIALSYTPWLRSLGVTDLNLLYLSGFNFSFG